MSLLVCPIFIFIFFAMCTGIFGTPRTKGKNGRSLSVIHFNWQVSRIKGLLFYLRQRTLLLKVDKRYKDNGK